MKSRFFPDLASARHYILAQGFSWVQEIGRKAWRSQDGLRALLHYKPFHRFYWVIQKEQ